MKQRQAKCRGEDEIEMSAKPPFAGARADSTQFTALSEAKSGGGMAVGNS